MATPPPASVPLGQLVAIPPTHLLHMDGHTPPTHLLPPPPRPTCAVNSHKSELLGHRPHALQGSSHQRGLGGAVGCGQAAAASVLVDDCAADQRCRGWAAAALGAAGRGREGGSWGRRRGAVDGEPRITEGC